MKHDILENYAEKVYGYAANRTSSREETDELAQQIHFTAVRELPKLKQEDRFEPWLWGIAKNVTKSYRRYLGKQRAMYSYATLEKLPYEEERFDDQEEVYDLLRRGIEELAKLCGVPAYYGAAWGPGERKTPEDHRRKAAQRQF